MCSGTLASGCWIEPLLPSCFLLLPAERRADQQVEFAHLRPREQLHHIQCSFCFQAENFLRTAMESFFVKWPAEHGDLSLTCRMLNLAPMATTN